LAIFASAQRADKSLQTNFCSITTCPWGAVCLATQLNAANLQLITADGASQLAPQVNTAAAHFGRVSRGCRASASALSHALVSATPAAVAAGRLVLLLLVVVVLVPHRLPEPPVDIGPICDEAGAA
jgi:hypothetical protein